MKIERKYFPINEQLAKTSQSLWSFSDYKTGSATESYEKEVEKAYTLAEKVAAAKPDRLCDALSLAERFSKAYAEWANKGFSIEMMCPSVMICGAGNFPVRKKEKQNSARDKHMCDYEYITGYLKKIENILYSTEVIRSDDKNAVQKIKDKIAMLETCPDPYGNNKAEIRRLKGRLLQLAPEETKKDIEITINGKEATFENIVAIFNESLPQKSRFSEDEERYYLNIPLCFSNGKRKYNEYLSNEVNEDCTMLSTYGNRENNYQTIWKPLTDNLKFMLIINKISGSGNKAVIYSILKDIIKKPVEQEEVTEESEEDALFKVVENTEIMRLQLLFDGIPEASTREVLKKHGFRWSPSNKAWQRLLNDNAKYSLKQIKKELTA